MTSRRAQHLVTVVLDARFLANHHRKIPKTPSGMKVRLEEPINLFCVVGAGIVEPVSQCSEDKFIAVEHGTSANISKCKPAFGSPIIPRFLLL